MTMTLTFYQVLCILGIPSLVGCLFGWIHKRFKLNEKKTTALELGVQALLRDRLIHCYEHSEAKGYATIVEKDNFQNMYKQYESLGENGVITDIHDKYISLPLSKHELENNN